jgi:hypothetical protein
MYVPIDSPASSGSTPADRFRGLGDAFEVAMDPRKLGILVAGTLVSWLLAVLALSRSASNAGWVVVALLVVWLGSTLTTATLTEASYHELTASQRPEWIRALTTALRRLHGYLLAPIVCGLLAFVTLPLLFLVETLVVFAGRLPGGELAIAVLFVPILMVNVLAIPTMMVVGWMVNPAISSGRLGTIGAPFRIVRQLVRDPRGFIKHGVVGWILAQGGLALLGLMLLPVFALTLLVLIVGLGPDKLLQLFGLGQMLAGVLRPVVTLLPWLGGASLITSLASVPATIEIARVVFVLGFAALAVVLFAFPSMFLIASGCSAFLAIWPSTPTESVVEQPSVERSLPTLSPA